MGEHYTLPKEDFIRILVLMMKHVRGYDFDEGCALWDKYCSGIFDYESASEET